MRLLLLFLDEPLPGQVMKEVEKTAGPEAAVRSYRAMIRVLLRQLSGLKDCRVRICYAPEDAEQAFRFWILPEIIDRPKVLLTPEDLDFVAQGPGPRSAQLEHHFAIAFEEGFEKVAAIGSECIEISARWINAAFSQLNGRHHGILGPTPGGRCHLLALADQMPSLFDRKLWEQPDLIAELLRHAELHDRSFYQLPALTELHTEADFNKALLGPLGTQLRKAVKELKDNGG